MSNRTETRRQNTTIGSDSHSFVELPNMTLDEVRDHIAHLRIREAAPSGLVEYSGHDEDRVKTIGHVVVDTDSLTVTVHPRHGLAHGELATLFLMAADAFTNPPRTTEGWKRRTSDTGATTWRSDIIIKAPAERLTECPSWCLEHHQPAGGAVWHCGPWSAVRSSDGATTYAAAPSLLVDEHMSTPIVELRVTDENDETLSELDNVQLRLDEIPPLLELLQRIVDTAA